MKLTCNCKNGEYRGIKIWCNALNNYCGNQRFKSCKGWWVLTDNAGRCPIKEQKNENADSNSMP